MGATTDPKSIATSNSPAGGTWKLWAKLALTLVFVGVLYSRLDLSAIARGLAAVDPPIWLGALAIYLLAQVISGYRWFLISRSLELYGSVSHFMQLYFASMFVSLCLPTSIGGDVYKAYRLARGTSNGIRAAASVLADRAIGLLALCLIGICGLACDWLAIPGWSGVLLVAPLAIASIAAMRLATVAIVKLANWSKQERFQLLAAWSGRFARQPGLAAAAMTLSLLVQLLNVLVVMLLAAGMEIELPARCYFAAVPLAILVTVLPISIGGAGVREGSLAIALSSYGLAVGQGVSLGIAWFAVLLIAGLLGGLVYLLQRSAKPQSSTKPQCSTGPQRTAEPALLPAVARTAIFEDLNMSVSIVVPVYNEQPNLRKLYDRVTEVLLALGKPYEILLVDDGSTDGSVEVLRELAAHDPAVKVVYFRRNYGQTAAMNAGLQMASHDVIVTLDADLQNDPSDIPMMLGKLNEGFDLVHGWRSQRQDNLLSRKIPSKIANWLISRVTRFPVHDLGCTLKAIRREFAQELELYGEMHRFIPILAHWRGARCVEVVTQHHPRTAGQSKYGLSRTLRVLLDLITVKYMIQYLASPMKLFGMVGLGALGVSSLAAIATIGMKLSLGIDMTGNPLLLLSAVSALASLQFIMLGMLGELGARTYYESQNKRPYAIRETINFDHHDIGAPLPMANRAA